MKQDEDPYYCYYSDLPSPMAYLQEEETRAAVIPSESIRLALKKRFTKHRRAGKIRWTYAI